jgi:hypothetical protein
LELVADENGSPGAVFRRHNHLFQSIFHFDSSNVLNREGGVGTKWKFSPTQPAECRYRHSVLERYFTVEIRADIERKGAFSSRLAMKRWMSRLTQGPLLDARENRSWSRSRALAQFLRVKSAVEISLAHANRVFDHSEARVSISITSLFSFDPIKNGFRRLSTETRNI